MAVRDGARRFLGIGLLLLSVLLAVVVWLGITVLFGRPALRGLFDFSPQARFTFSAETDELLSQLGEREQIVEIDTFYEPLNPAQAQTQDQRYALGMFARIRDLTTDLLRVYASRGGDAVKVTHYNRNADVARTTERIGELQVRGERNFIAVSIGKRHKLLSVGDDLADIDYPATSRQQTPGAGRKYPVLDTYKGEEAISTAIRSLMVEGQPKLRFLSGYKTTPIRQGVADSYSELAGALIDDGFEVGELALQRAGRIPDDIDVVAILEPKSELLPRDTEALMAFLRRGGRLFINFAYVALPRDWNPSFGSLLAQLGVKLSDEMVAHLVPDPRMPDAAGTGGAQAQNLYLQLDPKHPLTLPLVRQQRTSLVKAARALRPLDPDGFPPGIDVDFGVGTTGPYAWLAARAGGDGQPNLYPPSGATAADFANRSIMAVVDVDPEVGDRRGHVVLLGGVAFRNEGQAFKANGDLALNIFNWLAERRELVTVRGDRYRSRRLEVTEAQTGRISNLLIWGVPLGLLLFSIVVFLVRRRS